MTIQNESLRKYSVSIAGHRTSLSLEPEFWESLKDISEKKNMTLSALIREIDAVRGRQNLSSAIRVFILEYFRNKFSDRK